MLMRLSLLLPGQNFREPALVSLFLTVLGCQERLYQIPGHGRTFGPTSQTDDVDVIVLDSLTSGEVVGDQCGADTRNLVCTHGCANAAAANCHSALHSAIRDS